MLPIIAVAHQISNFPAMGVACCVMLNVWNCRQVVCVPLGLLQPGSCETDKSLFGDLREDFFHQIGKARELSFRMSLRSLLDSWLLCFSKGSVNTRLVFCQLLWLALVELSA